MRKIKMFNKNNLIKILLKLFIIITTLILLSSVSHNQKERLLITENNRVLHENDSLKNIIKNELYSFKENENNIFNLYMSVSEDTSYNKFTPKDYMNYIETKNIELKYLKNKVEYKWDSIMSVPFGKPISSVDLYKVTDKYGWRKHPIYKRWIFHNGIDFSSEKGMNIISTSNGYVEKIITNNIGYGNRIIINHGYGYKTIYAHLDKFNVIENQYVKKGDVIGYVGNTGLSTGPHIHYEVLVNNKSVDPMMFMFNGKNIRHN